MKILFLNAWRAQREAELRSYLGDHRDSMDVFCFQEAFETRDRVGAAVLTDFACVSARAKDVDHNGLIEQVTYVRRAFKLEKTAEIPGLEGNDSGVALYTRVRDPEGKVCNIINFYGLAYPVDKLDTPDRIRVSKAIIEFCATLTDPVVIGGDFNLFPETESVRAFTAAGYRDLIAEFKISTTRNEFVWSRYPDHKMLYSDYVFISKNVDLVDFSVPDKYPDNQVSDHLPMVLKIDTFGRFC